MTRQVSESKSESVDRTTAQLNVLGDECARTILVATSAGPRTAKELTSHTDCSSATVYRRINNLLESELLAECIRFEEDGTHTTAYEATVERLCVDVGTDGISVERSAADGGT